MQKSSKLTSLQANGTWDSNHGTMYKYELAFENGDAGEYSSKNYTSIEELKFKLNDIVHYEYVDGKYPKIKSPSLTPPQEGGFTPNAPRGNDADRQIMIVRQSSLTRAIEMCNLHGKALDKEQIVAAAEFFTNWVMTGQRAKPDTEVLIEGSPSNDFLNQEPSFQA